VDTSQGLFYFLGDTSAGTTLVALDLTDGSEVCSSVVDGLQEVLLVGLGQSLDFDSVNKNLVLSGISSADETKHLVYRTTTSAAVAKDGGLNQRQQQQEQPSSRSRAASCDLTFEEVGTFGVADYLPLLHASALDSDGQRLFVQLSASSDAVEVGIIPLDGSANMTVAPETNSRTSFEGFSWDPQTSSLLGIALDEVYGLALRSLKPDTGVWATKALGGMPAWDVLYGNEGTMSTLNPSSSSSSSSAGGPGSRALFFVVGNLEEGTVELGEVNIDTAEVVGHPAITGDVGLSASSFVNIEFVA
jgi:hypothetical protein